jgi:(p)ppGpp synthase/HD superfamily hydrolase
MNNQEMLSKAIQIAVNAHQGQYDKGGSAYILHPLKVMHYLKSDDSELQCIAVLHDVIEDTSVTFQDLEKQGMSKRVIAGVKCLTKQRGETFEEYQVKVLSNIDAAKVKLCDLRHNSDIRRLKGVTAKDIARIEKYHKMYLEIKAALEVAYAN